MTLEALRYFQYIAKYKNLTLAARHLFISQSTLSRQMMALEDELGVLLFVRNNKQMELTPAGEKLYHKNQSLLSHFDSVINDVQSVSQKHVSSLKIASPHYLHFYLNHIKKELEQTHPDIDLRFESYPFAEIPIATAMGLYDIGITFDFSILKQDELGYIYLHSDDFSILFPSQYRLETPEQTLRSLLQSLSFLRPLHLDPAFYMDFMARLLDYTPDGNLLTKHVNTTESMILNIMLGGGFGIVPTTLAQSACLTGPISMMPVFFLDTRTSLSLIYKKHITNPAVEPFLDSIRKSLCRLV